MLKFSKCSLLFVFIVARAQTFSLPHETDRLSGLSRVAAHAPRLEGKQETRLPLPALQELEALKKVAQVLVTLGEQVIPSIIGDGSKNGGTSTVAPEVSHDPVQLN